MKQINSISTVLEKHTGFLIGPIIITATLLFCASSFKSSLIQYIPFNEAKKMTNVDVQIMGVPVKNSVRYDLNSHNLKFILVDNQKSLMPVVFNGPKPDDMGTATFKATQIAAQGSYDPLKGAFMASYLLVKCPSKYQDSNERSYMSPSSLNSQ